MSAFNPHIENYYIFQMFRDRVFVEQGIIYLLFLVISSVRVSAATGGLPLSLNFDPPADRVRLDAPLTVRCELSTGDTDSRVQSPVTDGVSMLLHCPIAPWGSFCFLNCKSACADEEPGKCPFIGDFGNVTCQKVVTQEGYIKYEYTIPRLTQRWLTHRDSNEPGFYCRSAGLKTPEVWLTKTKDPPDAKPSVFLPNFQNPPIQRAGPETPALSVDSNRSGPEPNPSREVSFPKNSASSAQSNREADYKGKLNSDAEETIVIQKSDLEAKTAAITREILIVGAIVIVFVSVILNVFCCIRCALIRQYSKTKGPVHMQHLFCMAEEIRNARLVRQVRGGSQPGGAGGGTGVTSSLLVDHWDQSKSDGYRFGHSIPDGSFASGSRILIPNPSITLDPYHTSAGGQSSIIHGSEVIMNSNCAPTGMLISGAFSDTNSNKTAGVDVHTRYMPDGRIATLQSGSAFSLVSAAGMHPNASSSVAGSDRRSKASSLVMAPGQQVVQLWGPAPGQKHLITSVPAGYYIQSHQMEITGSQAMGSDGLGSCLDSTGQPDNSVLEPYQPSSSGISTLRRNSSSNKGPLPGTQDMKGLSSPPNIHQQQQQAITSPDESSVSFTTTAVEPSPMLNRTQPMGLSQPQLTNPALMARLNSSNSNPQLMHNFTPVYALIGTPISHSDSGTGSGSGPLHNGDSQSGLVTASGAVKVQTTSLLENSSATSNGLKKGIITTDNNTSSTTTTTVTDVANINTEFSNSK
ncbi:hypothetical protein FGIG_10469 [Fasciola gigantica]|uniref:Uncharacterized protein n=1 Tax=Fasciola gigantica TaxID=46835 RepID=A0A504Z488_FASGI|nr:hypothetical protein FGIG_10469 [Fasciola gigantica]